MDMTKEQIENFRKVLYGIVGAYAGLMSDEEVQAFRDKMQKDIDSMPQKEKGEKTNE
jgi:hypothetical protein